MRRLVVVLLATLLIAETSWAQRKPMVPMTAVSPRGKLTGKKKIFYLLRQLELTRSQRQQARGLIESLEPGKGKDISLELVYQLMAEIQQAEADGDEDHKKQLEQQLRELGQGSDQSEEEFFMNMEPELTDQQRAALRAARERLERNPSGSLRPIDVFRLLPRLDPTDEQQAKFDQLGAKLRNGLRDVKTLKDKDRFQMINGLLASIKKHLTPPQQEKFELGIRQLRPDLAHRLRVRSADTPPGDEDEDEEEEEEGAEETKKPAGD